MKNDKEEQIVFCPKCWRKKSKRQWIPIKDDHNELVDRLGKWETVLTICPDCSDNSLQL
jgi:hypothetical protein